MMWVHSLWRYLLQLIGILYNLSDIGDGRYFHLFISYDKSLCPPYEGVGRHIVFGMDPIGLCLGVSVGVAFCLLSNLWTVRWILTKFAQILH